MIGLFLFMLNKPLLANISFGQICCALVEVKGGVLCVPSRVNVCPETKEGPEGHHCQAPGAMCWPESWLTGSVLQCASAQKVTSRKEIAFCRRLLTCLPFLIRPNCHLKKINQNKQWLLTDYYWKSKWTQISIGVLNSITLNICHDYRNHRFSIIKASDILIEFAIFTKTTCHLVLISSSIGQMWMPWAPLPVPWAQ